MTIELHGTVRRGDLALAIDLSVAEGLTTVAGANGAGKTTLLRVLSGLEALDAGTLAIDGRVLDDPARGVFVAAHERDVAMLFQDHRLFPHLDVLDNVAFAGRRRGHTRAEARADAARHLDAVGMAPHHRSRPEALSLGQRQRVALARTLAAERAVVLLDEPLAAVDDPGRDELRRLLTSVAADHVLWVTHDPADAESADRRVTVADGRVRQNLRS